MCVCVYVCLSQLKLPSIFADEGSDVGSKGVKVVCLVNLQ